MNIAFVFVHTHAQISVPTLEYFVSNEPFPQKFEIWVEVWEKARVERFIYKIQVHPLLSFTAKNMTASKFGNNFGLAKSSSQIIWIDGFNLGYVNSTKPVQ